MSTPTQTALSKSWRAATVAALWLAIWLLPAGLAAGQQAATAGGTDAGYDEPDPDPGGGGDPGDLRLTASALSRSESGGFFTVGVERVGGNEGSVSVYYATSDGSAKAGSDYTATAGTLSWGDGEAGTKSFQVPILDDGADEPNETINVALSNAGGGAGLASPSNATLTIQDDDASTPQPGQLSFVSSQYSVGEWAGKATISVQRTGGSQGPVSADYSTSDASAADGADYQATSGTLSWADGESGNLTFDVTILDDDDEENAETVNLSLTNPTGGAGMGTSSATLQIGDDDATGECVEDEITLCLGSTQRFRITVVWRDFNDNTGSGKTFDFAPVDSGLFWFFGPANAEILLKVLNACAINGHYWFFSAATTNVEYTLTVTDTQADVTNTYSNPLGERAAAVTDITAFETCP